MRVISGERRGQPLRAVSGSTTRPTTDKVKESIFNMIGPYFDGGIGLDLYGGSGGLGIEALSRGLDQMIFVDTNRKAIETINFNVKQCRYTDRTEIYRNDAMRALKALIKREVAFTYIFLDPPYAKQNIAKEIELIDDHQLLNESGVIVCEHDVEVDLPMQIGRLTSVRSEVYGDTQISIYQYARVNTDT
ncbi:16S rRNA (guanine(966)-N(2))-methyltransferase RsmD [Desertibacillus haloalkaliphilus]|uniref:16S rRNA (guanine(966)-N(2))-methyltransferase RsmD n=1 Tax=Desertibacillus haloalkaliphilus TaxID=1328930 RepID=UPI001C2582DD|nr:16S rRNA (guanine(966)-N(2))-methyltransferase RsmD [Desertibacillus haloalkaliphilus]MBU8907134.1 16S rRNA (guanine(966)-N(2))-methyltransferase RsmD [Desertibacillus haloalkaliphilus]